MTDHPIRIAPSLLSCDFARVADDLSKIEQAGADWHHVDVMDGHFVPNISIGPPVVTKIKEASSIPLDVHLMITDPIKYAAPFAKAGADVLTFHIEVCDSVAAAREVIATFRDAGVAKVGVALNPATAIERVGDLLGEVDLVLVMSVVPGFGGQSFMSEVLPKVEWLRAQGYAGHVEMDGGLNAETLPRCAAAGTDVLVAGSAIYGSGDWKECIGAFRASAEGVRI
jgi:ribulose-phosphate 3-epimerase